MPQRWTYLPDLDRAGEVDGRAETERSVAVGATARDVAQRSIAPAANMLACRLDVYLCAGALG